MKKLAIFATLLTLVLSGCAENTLDNIAPEVNNEITLPDLTAGFADDDVTKTYVEESKYLRWHEADLITAFYGNTLNRQYEFKGKTGDNSGTFSLVPSGELGTGNALEAIYAIYPYDEGATITDKGEISLSLPATQYYAENSFGRGANTMIAVTESVEDTFLPFKNACGYLQLKLYNPDGGDVKSIEIRGNNSEKIAGSATATIEFGGVPIITMTQISSPDGVVVATPTPTQTVTLDCGDGVELGTTAETATEFWIVLPEVTFTDGITIRVIDSEGGVFNKSTNKEVVITRNDIQPMAAVEVEFIKSTFTLTSPEVVEIDAEGGKVIVTYEATGDYSVIATSFEGNEGNWLSFDITHEGPGQGFTIAPNDGPERSGKIIMKFGPLSISVTINQKAREEISIPNNEIWYTALEKIEPSRYADFGANYLSSTWDSTTGEGVIFFDGDVTSIGDGAFNCNEMLTSIIIPESVTTIAGNAFQGNRYLEKFEGKFASSDGHCLIIDGVLKAIACAGLSEYRIPDGVHTIDDRGCGCTWFNDFERIIVPGSVKTIGSWAFAESWRVDEIILEEGVEVIGDYAFRGCWELSTISFPSTITKIGSYAYDYCNDDRVTVNLYFYSLMPPTIESNSFTGIDYLNIFITAKALPNYINYYGDNYDNWFNWFNLLPIIKGSTETPMFNNTIDILNNEIRYQTFDGYICPPFFSDESDWGANIIAHRYNETLGCWVILFDDEVEQVCDNAYYSNNPSIQSRLCNITLPNSITRIGKYAFVLNNDLESVTIPENVTVIDDCAFDEMGASVFYCKAIVPPTIGHNAFFNKYDGCDLCIYVPASSEVAYKRQWLDLAPYIYPYEF